MDTSATGFWIMLGFWASALGGIALAVIWVRAKGRDPVSKALVRKSLDQRFERGELSEAEYRNKLAEL